MKIEEMQEIFLNRKVWFRNQRLSEEKKGGKREKEEKKEKK